MPAGMGYMGKIISVTIFIDALGVEIQEIIYHYLVAENVILIYRPVIFPGA